MKKFVFRFESVLKYRKNRRDLCFALLAQILDDDRRLIEQGEALKRARLLQLDELRRSGRGGDVDVDGAASRRYHAGQLTAAILQVQNNREIVAEQMELCRKALTRADQDVKSLEKLSEKYESDFRYREERRDALELEDAWTAARLTEVAR